MTLHIPTSLSKEKVAEFMSLYKDRFGDELSEKEAHDTALRLIRFVGIVVKDNPAFTRNLDDQE